MNLYELLCHYLSIYPNSRARYGSVEDTLAAFVDDERGIDTPVSFTSYTTEGQIDLHLPTYEAGVLTIFPEK
jgi:hypothetical protein